MYIPLCVKTDYSFLKSMIKIDELIEFLNSKHITSCGICDDNLFGIIEFYLKCQKNNIKPIIGLSVSIDNNKLYLYAKNYEGYQNLLKINTIMQTRELNTVDLEKYSSNLICVIPYDYKDIYTNLTNTFEKTFIGYKSEYEKNNALIITNNILFINEIKAFNINDTSYLKYLSMIEDNTNINTYEKEDYQYSYYLDNKDLEDIKTTIEFSKLIDINIPKDNIYIPKYKEDEDSFAYLYALSHKGLLKRLGNNENKEYTSRLNYELKVIKDMGFVDYFLIVYDYVLYAKKHDILVGPGRGSAAGCLVAYALGIIDIDPIKYDLLFDRFLNKDRITMPDIDIDFEDTKRGQVIDYLKNKYGEKRVANIMSCATLKAKQVLKDVAKVLDIEDSVTNILKQIDQKEDLITNYKKNIQLQNILKNNKEYQRYYKIAMKLEGLKRQTSTHAAGVVICSQDIDTLIPIAINNDNILTGCTKEYLEDLGLIKMDLLAIKNLRVIKDVLNLIKETTSKEIKLSNIPLDDKETLDMFAKGNTIGIFQFESEGMINFLQKLKPTSFEDIIAAIALFRPGPMQNIEEFIKRKHGKSKVTYLHPSLEDILKNTYGIIVYQEQIMQILVKMANFTFSEADNIRRAMSKKKLEIIQKERQHFIDAAKKNNYTEDIACQVYDLIVKFANYGFNKSHSVAYALIGYQMAYLKVHYKKIFYANLLNMNIASEVKTKEYIQVLKKDNIKIIGPNINESSDRYIIKDDYLLLPLGVIKTIGENTVKEILDIRKDNKYIDFFDFVKRTYKNSVTKKVIESLIYAGALDCFGETKQTLINNIDTAIDYSELTSEIDSPLILKPTLEEYEEYSSAQLISFEKETLGFYITNHPASKYNNENIMKLENIKDYFDKFIKTVVLVTRISTINTKKGDKMSFVTSEDESSSCDLIIFPNKSSLVTKFKKDDLIVVTGKVEKRLDKYQIIVSNIEKIN